MESRHLCATLINWLSYVIQEHEQEQRSNNKHMTNEIYEQDLNFIDIRSSEQKLHGQFLFLFLF